MQILYILAQRKFKSSMPIRSIFRPVMRNHIVCELVNEELR